MAALLIQLQNASLFLTLEEKLAKLGQDSAHEKVVSLVLLEPGHVQRELQALECLPFEGF